nr:reverse transcriptase domain-containing protein [Tanacetum cinerariifolium]
MFKQLHINITLADALILMPKYQKMLKALLSNKEKLQELANTPLNENCSAVILKKLLEKLGDPGTFLIPCGFSELKCKALADLADFVIVDYESDPRVLLILGRPFLRTTRALIDVHESINLINVFNNSSEDFLVNLFSNQPSGNPTFSSLPELTSPKVNDAIFDSEGSNVLPKKLLDLDSNKYLHPPLHDNPLSCSTTFSSNPFLEEFADELASPPKYNDDLQFDIESGLKEIEFMLYQDVDSSLKDSIDQSNLANPADNVVDSIAEMFTDEHALDYSSSPIFDEYDDDFLEVESDAENDFSKGDSKPSTNNKDKVFNPGILSQEKSFEIITRVVQDKKLASSNASLMLEDFDPSFYEPLFFKEVPSSKTLLLFSSKNKEKVFKPGIHTFEKVHSSFIPELSHQGYKIFKSPMKIFLFFYGKDTHTLAVPYLYFYPLNQFKYGGIGSS